MNQSTTTFVGMDVHKKAINVAVLLPGEPQPIEWQVANEPGAIRQLARKIQAKAPGEIVCCDEAGPCGYAVQRQLRTLEIGCQVVALVDPDQAR